MSSPLETDHGRTPSSNPSSVPNVGVLVLATSGTPAERPSHKATMLIPMTCAAWRLEYLTLYADALVLYKLSASWQFEKSGGLCTQCAGTTSLLKKMANQCQRFKPTATR